MKKLLLGVLLLVGVSAIELPVMAQSAYTPVCSDPQPEGYASCHASVSNLAFPNIPTGYSPQQLRAAYQLSGVASKPTTIAIVDAYDNPTIENDLNSYSSIFGLPPCTTANGCFKKVNQSGYQGNYPSSNSSWALEIALDVEIAHAICQNCNILLVEASNSSLSALGASINTAISLGATVVSNSYGAVEVAAETTFYDVYYYNHPGVAIVASTGDSGYGVQYPAASPYVTAVGGTTLVLNPDNTRKSETVWGGAGSGCSAYEPKPKWQPDTTCSKNRTVADVAADADPGTCAAIYDTTPSPYGTGWLCVGGTSLAAPLVAATYALAGNSSSMNGASHIYSNTSIAQLNRVNSGANGSCGNTYLCDASYSFYGLYNGPTGFGTPKGTGAF